MEVDSLSSSHPVSTPVENPTQIQEMFDDVSYDKVSWIPGAMTKCPNRSNKIKLIKIKSTVHYTKSLRK